MDIAWHIGRIVDRIRSIPAVAEQGLKDYCRRSYPDDVFIVSYPKSGNTWVRFLIGNYLTGCDCDWINVQQLVPDLHQNPWVQPGLPRPRFFKSHCSYTRKYTKVVYLVRDVRDVVLSYYNHLLGKGRIEPKTSMRSFVEDFNQGDVDDRCNWSDHVDSWMKNKRKDFMVLRYEDLGADTEAQLIRILRFAGVRVDRQRVKNAVEASRFDNMRALELRQRDMLYRRYGILLPSKFCRRGESKQWKANLSEDEIDDLFCEHKEALERLDYV